MEGTAENVINMTYRAFWTCMGTFGKNWGLKPRVVHWIYTMVIRLIKIRQQDGAQ
jgi:hypothetical protein